MTLLCYTRYTEKGCDTFVLYSLYREGLWHVCVVLVIQRRVVTLLCYTRYTEKGCDAFVLYSLYREGL